MLKGGDFIDPATAKMLVRLAIKILTDKKARQKLFMILGGVIMIPLLIMSMAWYIVTRPLEWLRNLWPFGQQSYLEEFHNEWRDTINPDGYGLRNSDHPGNWQDYDAICPISFELLMNEAMRFYGWPYVWGGKYPSQGGFDCSGIVEWAFRTSGVYQLPRMTAQGQWNYTMDVPRAEIRPGDLVFFSAPGHPDPTRFITHVGIYVGNNRMFHSSSGGVRFDDIGPDSWWGRHIADFGRLPITPITPLEPP